MHDIRKKIVDFLAFLFFSIFQVHKKLLTKRKNIAGCRGIKVYNYFVLVALVRLNTT